MLTIHVMTVNNVLSKLLPCHHLKSFKFIFVIFIEIHRQCIFSQKDGYRCDDPCSQFTLCQGGKCHYNMEIAENQERRECHCFGGFQGDYCDTDIDECTLNICRNEAICINHIGTCSSYYYIIMYIIYSIL